MPIVADDLIITHHFVHTVVVFTIFYINEIMLKKLCEKHLFTDKQCDLVILFLNVHID